MTNFEKLVLWRDQIRYVAKLMGEKMFLNIPDEWMEEPHWFCINGHVSGNYLKSEEKGNLCLGCHEPVIIGPLIGEAEFKKLLPAILSVESDSGI